MHSTIENNEEGNLEKKTKATDISCSDSIRRNVQSHT